MGSIPPVLVESRRNRVREMIVRVWMRFFIRHVKVNIPSCPFSVLVLERQSCVTSGEFARSSTNLSSRTDWNYKNGGEVAAIRTGTPARAALAVSYRSAVKGRHFYGAAPAETAVEKITRRFIDIVTRNTITYVFFMLFEKKKVKI